MSGIEDIKQPAKDWLADVLDNLSSLVQVGDEPSIDLELFGTTFEIRLKPVEIESTSQIVKQDQQGI